MYLNNLTTEEPSSLKTSPIKFERRSDLSAATRAKIAVNVKYFNYHGLVTQLATDYKVSRTFIYMQVHLFNELIAYWFGQGKAVLADLEQIEKVENLRRLLRYRLVGGCSINKCSILLKADQVKNASFGWCQQQLQQAGKCLSNMVNWQGEVVYASDEIYYLERCPILVSCDPISGAILRIDKHPSLTKEVWEKHWNGLKNQGIYPSLLTRDEGIFLKAAQKSVLKGVDFQPDTFHAVTHQFYKIEVRLSRKAKAAIKAEYQAEKAFDSVVEEEKLLIKWNKYEQAMQATQQALEELELFQWLYHYLRSQFRVVRSDGTLRCSSYALQETQTVLELFGWLKIDLSEEVKNVTKLLPDLFSFLDRAKEVVEQLQQSIPEYVLPFWMLYWQFHRLRMNTKNTPARKRLTQRFAWLEQVLQAYCAQNQVSYLSQKAIVFAQLNTIVQASSMVESINALIRPFLNESRGQISQEMLNLFMFYYNHRKFQRGKRKGFAPIELLTGKKLDKDWLELLLDKVCPAPQIIQLAKVIELNPQDLAAAA